VPPSARKNAVRPGWPGMRPPNAACLTDQLFREGISGTHCVNPLFSPGSIETMSIVFCRWVAR